MVADLILLHINNDLVDYDNICNSELSLTLNKITNTEKLIHQMI